MSNGLSKNELSNISGGAILINYPLSRTFIKIGLKIIRTIARYFV